MKIATIAFCALAALGLVNADHRTCGSQDRYSGTPTAHSSHSKIVEAGNSLRSDIPGTVTIPIVYNAFALKNGQGFVSDERFEQQTQTLNEAYAATPFQFVTDSIVRSNKKKFFDSGMTSMEKKMKKKATKNKPSNEFFHVYSVEMADGILGFATFPDMYGEKSFYHGVVIWHDSINGGAGEPYNLGDTLVHEAGHFLGLFHTWGNCGGNSCTTSCDDMVDDTPMHTQPDYECNASADDCSGDPGNNPVENYMNYGDDECLTHFTAGQAQRMIDEVCMYKPGIVTNNGGVCVDN